jgi:tripartite-type tricarboxylate transporter receptor subunit TctC
MSLIARTVAACTALLLSATTLLAQTYPDHPVRIIVPFAAGGPTDAMARILAQKLTENLGQSFVVENRIGAGGNIGMSMAAKSAPDGYTLIMVSSSFVVNPSLYSNVPYDAFKDFAPISLTAASPNLIVVHPSVPAKTIQELVALVRANPGKYSYAQPGIGTTPHLSGELLRLTFGLDIVSAPFGGAGPAIASVLAGHTPVAVTALPPAMAHVKSGTLRALAITGAKRNPELPDVPTMAEAGISGQEAETMQGLLAPAGTPRDIVDRLQREVAKIVAQPDTKGKLLAMGFDPVGNTPEQFSAYISSEITRWSKVIREAKLKIE